METRIKQQRKAENRPARFRGKPRFKKLIAAPTGKQTSPNIVAKQPLAAAKQPAVTKMKVLKKPVDPCQFLRDVINVFNAKKVLVIKTCDLIAELSSNPIYMKLNAKSLAAKLRPYKIESCGHWFQEGAFKRSAKGYKLNPVKKAYRRLMMKLANPFKRKTR